MVSSVKNLKNEIDTRLAGGGLSDLSCCQLQNASSILDNNVVYSVATINDLPNVGTNKGRFVYVESINEYRYSNGEAWIDDYDSNIKIEFNIFSWGFNNYGQLSDGTTVGKCSPVREISSSTNWCQVSAGDCHSSAVKTTGEIWSWGRNCNCALGINCNDPTTRVCSPVREITSSTDWCQVSAGGRHTSSVKTTGQIWSWGGNSVGQVPIPSVIRNSSNFQPNYNCFAANASVSSPVREFCSGTDWCQVSAGYRHTSAIKTTGEIWSWGSNRDGQLGVGSSTGGSNLYYRINGSGFVTKPVKDEAFNQAAVCLGFYNFSSPYCSFYCFPCFKASPVREISSSTDWCQVSAGNGHSSAVKTTGEIWSWGYGGQGRLGNGSFSPYCSPVREISSSNNWCQVSAGVVHTSAVKTTGEIWSWGGGFYGELGDGTTVIGRNSPVREISSSTNWCQVSAGNSGNGHSSAIKTTGEIWSWGANNGRLGDGTNLNKCSPVREISSSTNWCQVSAGLGFSSAIKLIDLGGFGE